MNTFGQLGLLVAMVGSGYAAFACVVGWSAGHRVIGRSGTLAAATAVAALTAVTGILTWALLAKDFGFAYVTQYSSRLLPWHYALSVLWVGQAGSLLLWAWLLGLLALAFRFWPRSRPSQLQEPAFGILMAYLCFLVAVMVFGADPMQRSLGTVRDGAGLSPLLQHPVMLLHPPVVFLGYAGWAIPFALAVVAVASGRKDADWVREARSWSLFSWAVLGIGIILGGKWAYEELGWGSYWSWDPVENGSLIPWLTGTALIHALLVWQYRGGLKKTALLLAIGTFALCNFAAFLTRSGVFGGLHAFSQSPIGWLFLALMGVIVVAGVVLVVVRWSRLTAERTIAGVWTREAWIVIALVAWLSLAVAVLVGTAVLPASSMLFGHKVVLGVAFYNNVLIPTGLLLMATMAAAPLLRWGKSPLHGQKNMLWMTMAAAGGAAMVAFACGVRSPLALAVATLAAAAAVALIGALILDLFPWFPNSSLRTKRQYAGWLIHLGFVCLAIGVTGSSLGTRRQDVVLAQGQTVEWAGRSLRCVRLIQRELPGKLIEEVRLEVSQRGAHVATLVPAQHLHLLQNEWTTEVAVHSTWDGDLYAILHGGAGEERVDLTLAEYPMMRWIWLGGWILGIGSLLGLWPSRGRPNQPSVVPPPKWIGRRQRKTVHR